jgi:hypothetical protein
MKNSQQQETSAMPAALDVEVRLDAMKLAATRFDRELFDGLEDCRLEYDYRIKGNPEQRLYNRARSYFDAKNAMRIGVAYSPMHSYMPACLVTLSPNDKSGMRRYPLEQMTRLPGCRFLKIEVAHDFCADSIVDAAFARKHLIVGKSRRTRADAAMMQFGARRSPVYARCYWKASIKCYRIEIEYHREWLKKHGIATTSDFCKLPDLTARHHIAFYRLEPLKLSACLARLGIPVAPALRKIIEREADLYAALDYMRREFGIVNALRVLTPLKTNTRVEQALRKWARDWDRQRSDLDEAA